MDIDSQSNAMENDDYFLSVDLVRRQGEPLDELDWCL
jgi:hypothetical protein